MGHRALTSATTGANNTAIGKDAGESITTSSYNICVGWEAGDTTVTTGDGNVVIGYNNQLGGAGQENSIMIGSGNSVGKGSSTAFITGNGGSTYNGGNTTTWDQTSDRRIKKNIVDNNVGLDAINKVRVRNFEYRTKEEVTELPENCAVEQTGLQLGVIAQEVQEHFPEMVTEESGGDLSVQSDDFTWYLINAIQELSAKVDDLENNNN